MAWTLEYNGQEKTLEAWGFALEGSRVRGNMVPDVVRLRAPGATESSLILPYGAAVIIRRDRTGTGPFAAGSVYFSGKAGIPQRFGSGQMEGVSYEIIGPWWDFTRLVFQQEWNEFAGWSTPGDPNSEPTFTQKRASEVFLAQAADGTKLTTGEQIEEAVSWAATCGVAVQLGTVDPAVNIPIYNARDITVAEVIQQMLRWTPDCVCYFDYSTSPATFHCRKAANMAEVAITADALAQSLSLRPRYDLQLPAVCLKFKKTDTVDGRLSTVIVNQNAPAEATGLELGASVHTIELQGSSISNVYSTLECQTCSAQAVTEADRIKWWIGDEANGIPCLAPILLSGKVDPASIDISSATVKDKDGGTISLVDYPNVLLNGQVTEWMVEGGNAVVEVGATVSALLEYDLYRVNVRRSGGVLQVETSPGTWSSSNTAKYLIKRKRAESLSVNVRLTNGATGTYSLLDSFSAGEDIPLGLATEIYNAHSTLQYEGELTLLAAEVPSNIGMGNKVRIGVGEALYSGILIQEVTEDLGNGQMTLRLGPATHLGLADLVELLRVNRHRLTFNSPAQRSQGSAAGSVALGKATAKENTMSGMGNAEIYTASAEVATGKTMVIVLDALSKTVLMEVLNADGTKDQTYGSLELNLGDCAGKHLKVREAEMCVNGVQKKVLGVFSEAYT